MKCVCQYCGDRMDVPVEDMVDVDGMPGWFCDKAGKAKRVTLLVRGQYDLWRKLRRGRI